MCSTLVSTLVESRVLPGVLNPDMFVSCGGVSALLRNIAHSQMPRIVECLCGALLFLLDRPSTRRHANVQLQSLAVPYCDFHWDSDRNREDREARFLCVRLALLSVLRSWPGILHFCHPSNSSGLQAIVSVLYLKQLEVRKAILDLLYDLLGLPQPEWTDEFSVALEAVDPSHPQDIWRLSEGFVAAEGKAVLPHLAKFRPNIVEIHLSVLLYTFLEAGLLDAIVEVIVTSDSFISVRATILLGELLQLIHLLLPPECCNITPPLPNLMVHASNAANLPAQHLALTAVAALSHLHHLLKRRPAPASLFLDQVLQAGGWLRPGVEQVVNSRGKHEKAKLYQVLLRNHIYNVLFPSQYRYFDSSLVLFCDNEPDLVVVSFKCRLRYEVLFTPPTSCLQLIMKDGDEALKDSAVLSNKDGFSWNWNIVRAVLKVHTRNDALCKLEDSNHRTFLKRLVHYFKPSSNRFSRVELGNKKQTQMYTLAGCELLDCLLEIDEPEGSKLLTELLSDISTNIDVLMTSKSAHDCFFSPHHVTSSVCQDYFLFIGRLCRSSKGMRMLDKSGIFQKRDAVLPLLSPLPFKKMLPGWLIERDRGMFHHVDIYCEMENGKSERVTVLDCPGVVMTVCAVRTNEHISKYGEENMLGLLNLVVSTNHDCYVKLVVSSLDYTTDAMPRVILSKVLTASTVSSRLYATQFLLVLLRAKLPDFQKWGVELLVNQLYDQSKAVSLVAITILEEATEEKVLCPSFTVTWEKINLLAASINRCYIKALLYLESVIALRPSLLHLGDKGLLLLIRFLSTPTGFTFLQDANFVSNELERWSTNFNYRYVRLIEGDIHDSFTLHQRGEDGRYSRRITNAKHCIRDVFVPPHLYGQLVQHDKGFQLLLKEGKLENIFQVQLPGVPTKHAHWLVGQLPHLPPQIVDCFHLGASTTLLLSLTHLLSFLPFIPNSHLCPQIIHSRRCSSEQDILELKAALWGCGHIATFSSGVKLLAEEGIIVATVQLAETCPVYCVRGTALYVLALMGTTRHGATELNRAGWLCVRHHRHDRWPVIEQESNEDYEGSLAASETDNMSLSSGTESDPSKGPHHQSVMGHFYISDEAESVTSADDEGLLLDESSVSAHWIDTPGTRAPHKSSHQRKSQTLPHSRPTKSIIVPRHIRSLSESKQSQIPQSPLQPGDWPSEVRARDMTLQPPGAIPRVDDTKSRSNSCTDSSGVSSCDSGLGRHVISERIQTLSPIPSSASLSTLKSAGIPGDKTRKMSYWEAVTVLVINTYKSGASPSLILVLTAPPLLGSTTSEGLAVSPDVAHMRLSQQDLLGYATLRSLKRHCRPMYSDTSILATAELIGFDDHGASKKYGSDVVLHYV
uniref:Rapamycin-insensitive companion of mTOR n=1 Tax=Timema cristinae TaxID=61476 RepID=A0A7R9GZ01_TIMCR|nr:unnamed protein product [Timema cristinae]